MATRPHQRILKGWLQQERKRRASHERPSPARSRAGFLLIDSSLKPIYINDDALDILNYPDARGDSGSLRESILATTRALLSDGAESPAISRIASGRRHYNCRFFSVFPVTGQGAQPMVGVLIERGSPPLDLLQISTKFGFTHREAVAVQFLMQGLTSKEIATRMGISPNTVKAFLRLAMLKAGVTTRSGIIGKFLQDI
jgi:DNA-binding CsgD family transcriptional regulator